MCGEKHLMSELNNRLDIAGQKINKLKCQKKIRIHRSQINKVSQRDRMKERAYKEMMVQIA